MIKAHDGYIEHKHSFSEVYSFLNGNNKIKLSTSTGKEFIANAAITQDGRKVIRFNRKGIESARAYECCWGHYYNCNRTRFGMYAKALDETLRGRY